MKNRLLIGVLSFLGLVAVYVFQRTDFSSLAGFDLSSIGRFIFNRTCRFLVNDFFMLGVIYALFPERKYVVFALWVQLTGVIVFLIPYFILKVYWPSYNGPLISHLHRLVLNPTLMLLLIPSFYFQKKAGNARPN
jgi:exosortase F-associated protein